MNSQEYSEKISTKENNIEPGIRKSNSMIAIKDLLDNKNYIVVLDANILLKLYRASPDYAEYALECLDKIKEYIFIPFNVQWEYEKHRNAEYNKKVKCLERSAETCNQLVSDIREKIKGRCIELSKNGFPDVDELITTLSKKLTYLEDGFDSYFMDHQNLDYLNNWDDDRIQSLVNSFGKMPEPTASFIYKQCQEGENRYKKKIPPGYKDEKKDGVSKYGDFLVWVETYTFASLNNKNIIFVTDDVKEDWWENLNGQIFLGKN